MKASRERSPAPPTERRRGGALETKRDTPRCGQIGPGFWARDDKGCSARVRRAIGARCAASVRRFCEFASGERAAVERGGRRYASATYVSAARRRAPSLACSAQNQRGGENFNHIYISRLFF